MNDVIYICYMSLCHKRVDIFKNEIEMKKCRNTNISSVFRLAQAIPLCVSFVFQETSVLVVHVIGAMMTFVLGTVYLFLHSFITYKMHPEINSRHIFYARITISALSFCALFGGILMFFFQWIVCDIIFLVLL